MGKKVRGLDMLYLQSILVGTTFPQSIGQLFLASIKLIMRLVDALLKKRRTLHGGLKLSGKGSVLIPCRGKFLQHLNLHQPKLHRPIPLLFLTNVSGNNLNFLGTKRLPQQQVLPLHFFKTIPQSLQLGL